MKKGNVKKEETFYDKVINRFKNNVLITILLVCVLLYSGITELIKNTKENHDNLFGENGLIKPEDSNRTPFNFDSSKMNVYFDTVKVYVRSAAINERKLIYKNIRDTITVIKPDTVYITDTSVKKDDKYFFRLNDLREGMTFLDPLTNSSISVFKISEDFTASAILDYPDGFYTIHFDKPEPVKVRPGDSWNNVHYNQKNYKMTITDINSSSKSFSVEIRQTD